MTWVGQFSVSRDTNGDGDFNDAYEQVRTYGLGIGMNHCATSGAAKVHMGNASHAGSSVALQYGPLPTGSARPASCAGANNRNPKAGTYTISYLNTGFGEFLGGNAGRWSVDGGDIHREHKRDCRLFGGNPDTWVDADNELVYPGSGTVSVNIGIDKKPSSVNSGNEIADLPGTESAICIQQKVGTYQGTPDGAQAPIIVI